MLQPFAILVSEKDELTDVTVPFVTSRSFAGRSRSRVIDDVALHLMERVFEERQENLPGYQFAPDTFLRRVKLGVDFRDGGAWEGRLSVVLRRWPDERWLEATIPRLGVERFAVESATDLELTVAGWLRERAKRDSAAWIARLEATRRHVHEHLEWIEVDLELPTVLPRTAIKQRRASLPRESEAESIVDRAKRRRETPPLVLREVGTNLVHRVLDGRVPRVIGREALVDQLAARVARPGTAILLVGPSGAGKSAIIEAVIAKLTAEEDRLHARRDAWLVDANRIIAGMSYVGQWEARCEQMVHELRERDDILVVDDLPSLVYAGRTVHEETHVAGYLDGHLAEGELRVLAECTPERLEALRDEAPSFFERFHVLRVPPLDEETTVRVLVQRIRELEAAGLDVDPRGRTHFAPEIPESVLALTRRFFSGRALPGRAVELLHQLAAEAPEGARDELGRLVLGRSALVDLFARKTGLPRFVLWEEDGKKHGEIRAHFERRIVAQPAACESVTEVVTTLQQGLEDPTKPIASMLLVGPTGVGKTETAKALAQYLFGSDKRLLRFDMSELGGPASAARLFGDARSPDGELTRRVRQQPFAVILFDEIEKAHPAVFDALLQLLGEGRLTSASGITTDFTSTVVLMTSNLGASESESRIGFEDRELPDRSAHYVSAARAFFRPELFNRIDRIVPFRSLGRDAVGPLVTRALSELTARRGLLRSGVLVEVDDSLVDVLGERGFDARYGARALKREVEQRLAVPLARRLVEAPPDRTTLVSLFRQGDDVGMDVWPLDEPRVETSERAPARDFEALARMHAAICARLDTAASAIERARDELGRSLAQYSRGVLADTTRLDVLAAVIEAIDEARGQLARFQDEVLLGTEIVATIDPAPRSPSEHFWRSGMRRTPSVVSEHVVHRAEVRPTRRQVSRLDELAIDVADALFRLQALARPEERVLLRVLPATRDPLSVALGRTLAAEYARLALGYGSVETLARRGTWSAEHASEEADGWAIAVRGYGVAELFAPELGFHLESRVEGPDVITGLARVESVAFAESLAGALHALDREYDAFLAARREGVVADHPRGPLPVRRRIERGAGFDPRTGAPIEPAPLDLLREVRARLGRTIG